MARFNITADNGVASLNPGNLFVYCGYWRTWSRVLRFAQPLVSNDFGQVEVDMIPREGRTINIRKHHTARGASDFYSRYLPLEVVAEMQQKLGNEITQRLLHDNFLEKIDWNLYNQHNNGGAEFDKIRIS